MFTKFEVDQSKAFQVDRKTRIDHFIFVFSFVFFPLLFHYVNLPGKKIYQEN